MATISFQVLLNILYFAFVCFGDVEGSKILFQAFPSSLKANLSSSASMRCELIDTGTRRTVTNTTEDILHVTSILITYNDGQAMAQASAFDAPMALMDVNNLDVKGDVTGSLSHGYIELSWKDPALVRAGGYSCEVNTIDSKHHTTIFSKSLELNREDPTLDDVISMLKMLQHTTADSDSQLRQEVANLKQENAAQSSTIKDLQQENTVNAAEIKDLKQKDTNKTAEIKDLKQKDTDKTAEINDLKQKDTDKTAEISALKQKYNEQTAEINALKQKDQAQNQLINSKTNDISKLKSCVRPNIGFMSAVTGGSFSLSSSGVILFYNEKTDTSSSYDPHTGMFVCPVSGLYTFTLNVMVTDRHYTHLYMYVNNHLVTRTFADKEHSGSDYDSGSASIVVSLNKGDRVYVKRDRGDTGGIYECAFMGHMVVSDDCNI